MSHSRENMDDTLFLIQKDLKNYNRSQLRLLASYYGISTHLNKQRLTMEIAKENLKHSNKKARMEPRPQPIKMQSFSGKGRQHLNKQELQQARKICLYRIDKLNKRLGNIRSEYEKSYNQLELNSNTAEFKQSISSINSECTSKLDAIEKCISKAVGGHVSPPSPLRLSPAASPSPPRPKRPPPLPKRPLPSRPKRLMVPPPPLRLSPAAPPPSLQVSPAAPPSLQVSPAAPPSEPEETPSEPEETPSEPEETPSEPEETPSEAEETPSEPEETPSEAEETPSEPEETPSEPEETPSEAEEVPGLSAEIIEKGQEWFPQVPKATFLCRSDADCEAAQDRGELSGLHPKQKVICVTKRDGTPDCVYEA